MCACVCFPEMAGAGRGRVARGAKKTAPWWQIKWREKKEEKGDYMLCNHDNRKENTGGLKCESLCPEECKRQGWFDIINQNSLSAPESSPHPLLPVQMETPTDAEHFSSWAPQDTLCRSGTPNNPGVLAEVWAPSEVRGRLRAGSGRPTVAGESHWAGLLSWPFRSVTSRSSCISSSWPDLVFCTPCGVSPLGGQQYPKSVNTCVWKNWLKSESPQEITKFYW